jgi:hypothetical protein
VGHELEFKWHQGPPHLLAQLRGCFSSAERRPPRRSTAVASPRVCVGGAGLGARVLGEKLEEGGGAGFIQTGGGLGMRAHGQDRV